MSSWLLPKFISVTGQSSRNDLSTNPLSGTSHANSMLDSSSNTDAAMGDNAGFDTASDHATGRQRPKSMIGTALSITYDTAVLGTAVAYSLWRDTKTLGAEGDNADVDRHLARTRLAKAKEKKALASIELPPPPPYEETKDELDAKDAKAGRRRRKSPARERAGRRRPRADTRRGAADPAFKGASDSSDAEISRDPLERVRNVEDDILGTTSSEQEQDHQDELDDEEDDDEPKDAATLELASRIQSLITSGTQALSYQPPKPQPPPRTPSPPHTSLPTGPATPSRIPLPASPAVNSTSTPATATRRHSRRQSLDVRLLSSSTPLRHSHIHLHAPSPSSSHRKVRGGSLGGAQSELSSHGIGSVFRSGRSRHWTVSEDSSAQDQNAA